MIELIVYSIAAFGFAYVVGASVISKPARMWIARGEDGWIISLIECPACLGWWTGAAAGIVIAHRFGDTWAAYVAAVIVLAFYTAGSNYILGRATGLMPPE